MRTALLEAWTYAEFAACAGIFLPALAAARLLNRNDPGMRLPGQWMRRFGRTTSRLTPMWRFSVEGEPPADIDRRAYVVVANHESNADPFLLSWLPWDMRWIAKEELFKVPWIGWMMQLGGDVPIRRGDKESARDMHDECLRTLRSGVSVMVFPEGTRSRDGNMLPFKDGAFRLAIEAGVPVLPVAIRGTRSCMQKGKMRIGQAQAVAKVLAPIDSAGLSLEALREAARSRIAEALGVSSDAPTANRKSNSELSSPSAP